MLSGSSAIMFTSPMLVSILAIPILGEKVGPHRWNAIIIAFLGTLIVARPGAGVMGLRALFLSGCACCAAFYPLATRKLQGTDDARTIMFYTGLAGAPVMGPHGDWRLAIFVALGVCDCLRHFTLIKAFQLATATVVSPITYIRLIWATLYGFFIFSDLPHQGV
jgi:drug/metabolite transporter (DMT)-like permease